jgi:hypothetical protein
MEETTFRLEQSRILALDFKDEQKHLHHYTSTYYVVLRPTAGSRSRNQEKITSYVL